MRLAFVDLSQAFTAACTICIGECGRGLQPKFFAAKSQFTSAQNPSMYLGRRLR
jgi:hypothetical protein